MKKEFLILASSLCAGLTSCQQTSNLTGRWMEILPPEATYTQGMELSDDGTARSIGMQTLQYHTWKSSAGKLILEGESIGNGQTIAFSDTMRIVDLRGDTLILERGDCTLSFVRDNATETAGIDQRPVREPYEGFEWRELSGAGLKLWVQQNEHIRLLADPTLPGVVMVRDSTTRPTPVIRLFDLPHNDINDVIGTLQQLEGWDATQTCRFEEIDSKRPGVRRYVLLPDGEYARKMEEILQKEPVPSTCNGWGVGNSGSRYFEIHENEPDKALFVEIGQEAPLFDETSIELTKAQPTDLAKGMLYTLEGVLRIGHEVRSFTPQGSEKEFWIVDKTGELNSLYDQATHGMKNGQPLHIRLKAEYDGQWEDGFAAEYDGVYLVREILSLGK